MAAVKLGCQLFQQFLQFGALRLGGTQEVGVAGGGTVKAGRQLVFVAAQFVEISAVDPQHDALV